MTIEELNKLIQEELKAYLDEDQTDEAYMEDGDDDIEVTTDEPEESGEDEALDTLRQIYNMLKPMVEPEEEEEPEMDMDDEEGGEDEDDEGEDLDEAKDEDEVKEVVDNHTFYRGDNVGRTVPKAKDVQGTREKASLKEGFEGATRFQKLANIKG